MGEHDSDHRSRPRSRPIHPALVHFPIALLVLSVAADTTAFWRDIPSLRSAGWWSLAGAFLGALAAVPAGIFDMRRADLRADVHERVHRHMKVGFALLAALGGLTFWRWTMYGHPGRAVPAVYLDAGILTVALAGLQGWLGGELVYTDAVSVRRPGRAGAEKESRGEDGDHGHHHH